MKGLNGLGFRKDVYKTKTENNLSNYLPWAVLVAPGVVLQKDGILQKTYAFRGPDLDASSASAIAALSWQTNNAVKRLPSGWALCFEAQRYSTVEYPGARFSNRAAYLIDAERQAMYSTYGTHYESSYYLTFAYLTPTERMSKATGLFTTSGGADVGSATHTDQIEQFVHQCQDIVDILASKVDVEELDDTATLSYLHTGVSLSWHVVRAPDRMMFLDQLLADTPIESGSVLKQGDQYTPIVSVNDFPTETYPGILDAMNGAGMEYRWVTRFIAMDKEESLKLVDKYQTKFFNGRKSWKQLVGEAATKKETARINQGAVAEESDTNAAQVEVMQDQISFGYYTSTVEVWDENLQRAQEKAQAVKGLINGHGFVAKVESLNSFQAWLGMMPGNVYANVRRLPVSSGNLSHVIPFTAIWAGEKANELTGTVCGIRTPHVVCSTAVGTPFFLNLNVGDVGHTFIAGPTGAGKSTLLALLAAQWLKYPKAQVICFDKDRSMRKLTMAVGGEYFEPGSGTVTFQPLRDLETDEDLVWAAEFIELMLSMQKIEVNAAVRKAISLTLSSMRGLEMERRTITSFSQYVQFADPETGTNTIREALYPYTLEGPYGSIFDASSTTITGDSWMMFEMGALMQLGEAVVTPGLWFLFHYVETFFDPDRMTIMFLDEAWLFLAHPLFQKKIQEWLKVLRKKHVFVVFATQEIADAAKSSIATTIIQQCNTKIFLVDDEAPTLHDMYASFGLTDAEIDVIAHATKKRDYFYKSTKGTRLFQLDLGKLTLGLTTNPDHAYLDSLLDLPRAAWLDQIIEHEGLADEAAKYMDAQNSTEKEMV